MYADAGQERITEQSPRLLDACKDEKYLKTDEYALAKAREENILKNSKHRNWTIIRPYITYNVERLQLGVFEKELWLWRALKGRAIVFSEDIAQMYTTLTYAYDVALRTADLMGNDAALGETFHITTDRFIKWADVLNIYLDVLEEKLGKRPPVCMVEKFPQIKRETYQVRYDRLFDRKFDNSKIRMATGRDEAYVTPEDGLKRCLSTFIDEHRSFRRKGYAIEGVFDRIAGEKMDFRNIPGWKSKGKYLLTRSGAVKL